MSQVKKQVELSNFSGGFNTEQSPLDADPSTTLAEANMVLASDGSRARRYGYGIREGSIPNTLVEYERLFPPVFNFSAISSDIGGSVYEDKDYTFVYSYSPDPSPTYGYVGCENSASDIAVSTFSILGLPLLLDFSYRTTQTGSQVIVPNGGGILQFTPGDGTTVTDPIGAIEATLFVRDLWGLEDGTAIDERPTTLTEDHAYNLINQGWGWNSIVKFNTDIGAFPSNSDAPYFGLLEDTTGTTYDPVVLSTPPFPSGAPKGRIRLAVDSPDFSRQSAHIAVEFGNLNSALGTTLSPLNIGGGVVGSSWVCTSATSYLGRVFYSGNIEGKDYYGDGTQRALGSKTPSFNNVIFFSKIVDTDEIQSPLSLKVDRYPDVNNPFMCHSTLDPTTETFSPTATDGGFVFITGAAKLLGTVATRNSLLIIATNGVWELQAMDGLSPATFTLFKILDEAVLSIEGVTSVNDTVIVPTASSIYAIGYDGNSRRSVPSSLTDASIRSFYRKHAGWIVDSVHDEARYEVRWLLTTPPVYTDGVTVETVEQKELVLDLRLGSFYINTFTSTVGVVRRRMYSFADFERVYWSRPLDADITPDYRFVCRYLKLAVPYNTGEYNTPIDTKRNSKQIKLLIADGTNTAATGTVIYTIWEPSPGEFKDFGLSESEPAYMVTNPITLGDTIRRKDIPYIWTHFYRSEDGFEDDGSGDWVPTNQSGCLLSARWDFSDSANSGKWSTPKQVYRYNNDYLPEDISDPFDYGHSIITTKNNITGAGKAVSLRFESDGDKDLQLIGFGAEIGITGAI